jgi:hypothetical protein
MFYFVIKIGNKIPNKTNFVTITNKSFNNFALNSFLTHPPPYNHFLPQEGI